jgi:hypothetical protein
MKWRDQLDEARNHQVTRDTFEFIHEIAGWIKTAHPLYGVVLGCMLVYAVGMVIPILFRIYGTAFGVLGVGLFRVIGCFFQICGAVGGLLCWAAAARSFYLRRRAATSQNSANTNDDE